jgi:hypothetical protein
MKTTALIIQIIVLTGCASTYNPEKLSKTSRNECIYISEDSYWREGRGIVGMTMEEGVTANKYKAEYEDKNGIFFTAEGRAVWWILSDSLPADPKEDKSYRSYSYGGIWISKDKTKNPRIFYVSESKLNSTKELNDTSTSIANNTAGVGNPSGAIGGAIATSIISAMIESENGKMVVHPQVNDEKLASKLSNVVECQ